MRTELVVDALQMALARRRPAPGLVWHSDQGSQFVSLTFGQACGRAGIARSMGSRGDCYDNAVAESFFATLKKELVHRHTWPTRRELTTAVFDYVEGFYNPRRRHSTLGMLSPTLDDCAARSASCGNVRQPQGFRPHRRQARWHPVTFCRILVLPKMLPRTVERWLASSWR